MFVVHFLKVSKLRPFSLGHLSTPRTSRGGELMITWSGFVGRVGPVVQSRFWCMVLFDPGTENCRSNKLFRQKNIIWGFRFIQLWTFLWTVTLIPAHSEQNVICAQFVGAVLIRSVRVGTSGSRERSESCEELRAAVKWLTAERRPCWGPASRWPSLTGAPHVEFCGSGRNQRTEETRAKRVCSEPSPLFINRKRSGSVWAEFIFTLMVQVVWFWSKTEPGLKGPRTFSDRKRVFK